MSPSVVGCQHIPKECIGSIAVFNDEKFGQFDSEEFYIKMLSSFVCFLLNQTVVKTDVHPNPEHAQLPNQSVPGIVAVQRRREVLMGPKAEKLLD